MKNLKLLCILSAFVGFVVIGCSKDNSGAAGATGPAGPAGAAGATGPAGPAGTDSVIYSNWILLAMTYDTAGASYDQTINAPALTQKYLDSGFVLTYVEYLSNGDTVISSPTQLGFAEIFSVGQITLHSFLQDYSGSFYRFILVPGSIATTGNSVSGQLYTKQQLQTMTYAQVQKILSTSGKVKTTNN